MKTKSDIANELRNSDGFPIFVFDQKGNLTTGVLVTSSFYAGIYNNLGNGILMRGVGTARPGENLEHQDLGYLVIDPSQINPEKYEGHSRIMLHLSGSGPKPLQA